MARALILCKATFMHESTLRLRQTGISVKRNDWIKNCFNR